MTMTAPMSGANEALTAVGEQTRSVRTGVLIHPASARGGRFLVLPHPRTGVPTYYLHSDPSNPSNPSDHSTSTSVSTSTSGSGSSGNQSGARGSLFELSTLKDGKYDRSWMISSLNQVVSSGQLEILAEVDVRFLVVALLYGALTDGKFRSHEDTFDQIALAKHSVRTEEMTTAIPTLKAHLNRAAGETTQADAVQQEWTDLVTFGNLPIVKSALKDIADVQELPNGEEAYRFSVEKVFAILDAKHGRLSSKSTFVASTNVLGRSFERRWQSDSDPSAYLTASTEQEEADCPEAQQLRARIAAEIIATNLPPRLATEYFAHLGIALDN